MHLSECQSTLEKTLAAVRFRYAVQSWFHGLVQASLILLPVASIVAALLLRYGNGEWIAATLGFSAAGIIGYATLRLLITLGRELHTALWVDNHASLYDRITSALEFMRHRQITPYEATQIRDAVAHAQRIKPAELVPYRAPAYSWTFPVLVFVLTISLFVPPLDQVELANADLEPFKDDQLALIESLEEELEMLAEEQDEELQQLIEQVRELNERYEANEISEREVMIELQRMEKSLAERANDSGAESLKQELQTIAPNMMSSMTANAFAKALMENRLDDAVAELNKLSEMARTDQLTQSEKKELASAMSMTAAKLGSKSEQSQSFQSDFSKASEALKKNDTDSFCKACNSMGNKLGMLAKHRAMKKASQKVGMCKAGMGQCKSGQCQSNQGGYKMGPKQQGNKQAGLKAGTAASGDALGARNRLGSSYREMVRVSGTAGEGPVESEVEMTEGQLSESQTQFRDLYAQYESMAEEALDQEAIPMSHRYHVKRYFQSIRPDDQ